MSEFPVDTLQRLVSATLSRILEMDEGTARRLARLEGRVIALAVKDREWRVTASVSGGRIAIVEHHEGAIDVHISGRPGDFIALVRANQRGESLAAGRIEITGDLAVAQEVQALLRDLDVEPEELLSRYVGDVAAHRIGRAARFAGSTSRRTAERFEQDLMEYLRHELRAVPTRDEVTRFMREVYALDEQVERAHARLRRLAGRRRER